MEILPNSLERETGQVSYGMPGQGRPLHPQHFELPHQGVERQSGPFPSLTNLIPDQVADPNSSIASTTSELKEAKEEEGEKKGDKKTKKDKKDKSDFQTVYRKTKKSSIHRRITELLEGLFPDNPASLLRSYLHHSKRGQEINREMKLIEEKSTKSFPSLIDAMKKELGEKKGNKELEDLFIKLLCSSGFTREDVRESLGVKKLGWKRWKKFRAVTGKKKEGSQQTPISTTMEGEEQLEGNLQSMEEQSESQDQSQQ